ncbi:nitrate- and nitrite sensing domain-containing protein [Carbonactinospora thermoautotrophica]|uniref:sensor histidine kinase n=1 Tax=Carbonactinospora thermoautotrophica TaxID=1469144 RepID=UPI003DA8355D
MFREATEAPGSQAAKSHEREARQVSPRFERLRDRFLLRHQRVHTRLLALILLPLLVAVVSSAVNVAHSWQDRNRLADVQKLTVLVRDIGILVHHLEEERDHTAVYIAKGRRGDVDSVTKYQEAADSAVDEVREAASEIDGSFDPSVRRVVQTVRDRLDNLPALREATVQSRMRTEDAVAMYTSFIKDLLDTSVQLSESATEASLGRSARAIAAFTRLKELTSRERALLMDPAINHRFDPIDYQNFLVVHAERQSVRAEFLRSASPRQRQYLEDGVTGPEVDSAEGVIQQATLSPVFLAPQQAAGDNAARQQAAEDKTPAAVAPKIDADLLFRSLQTELRLMYSAEQRLVHDLEQEIAAKKDAAQRNALLTIVIVLISLLLTIAATLYVARSMAGPLLRLRRAAQEIANERLPNRVRELNESDPHKVDLTVEPIDITSRDEIGEVARAFDEVHREAVRLASEQALLRSSVNAMFVNLSRRTQSLVQRQLKLIDELERSERDPDQLANLFKLDHLATRMRRNGENLLILAGEEPGRRWNQPIPLIDILRAAASEVEQYERVQVSNVPSVDVVGRAVNDLVHLIAELLENATSYSAPGTKVWVSAQTLPGGGVMVEIEDNGIGMSPDELADANRRLAEPPAIDVSVSRRMGLFVVGRLAARNNLRVRLRSSAGGGVTALVTIPAELIADPTRLTALGTPDTGSAPVSDTSPVAEGPSASERLSPRRAMPEASGILIPRQVTAGELGRRRPALPSGRATPPHSPPVGVDLSSISGPRHASGRRSVGPAQGADGRPGRSGSAQPTQDQPTPASGAATPGDPRDQAGAPGWPVVPPPGAPFGYPIRLADPGAADQRPGVPQPAEPAPVEGTRPAEQPAGEADATPLAGLRPVPPGAPEDDARENTPEDDARENTAVRLRPAPKEPDILDPSTPLEGVRVERLPICEAIESEWFRRRTGPKAIPAGENGVVPLPATPPAGSPTPDAGTRADQPQEAVAQVEQSTPAVSPPPVEEQESPPWRSAADEGWKAAEMISKPIASGLTPAGLPKRIPKANLVPGSAGGPDQIKKVRANPAARSPEAVRGRLASYHQGIRRGRLAGRELRERSRGTLPDLPAVSSDEQENS